MTLGTSRSSCGGEQTPCLTVKKGLWCESKQTHCLLSTPANLRGSFIQRAKAKLNRLLQQEKLCLFFFYSSVLDSAELGGSDFSSLPIFLSLFLLYFLLGTPPLPVLFLPVILNWASTACWLYFHSSPSAKIYSCIVYQMLTAIMVSIGFWVKAWIETSSLGSLPLWWVSFQALFRLKKGNTAQLGPARDIYWTTTMGRCIFVL